MACVIRACEPRDVAHVQAIYAHHVATGFGTFEETAPDAAEMLRRFGRITAGGYPYFVAEVDGRIAGFAYAAEYRPRSAYRYTCESSVYVAADAQRRGVGRALMLAVIEACERRGLREMLAVIGDSQNRASVGLHLAVGFREVGTFEAVGFKLGRWVDTVLMQRPLGR